MLIPNNSDSMDLVINPHTRAEAPLNFTLTEFRRHNPNAFPGVAFPATVQILSVDAAPRSDGSRGTYTYHVEMASGVIDGDDGIVDPSGRLMVTIPGYAYLTEHRPFLRLDNPWLWVAGGVPLAGALWWWWSRR